MGTLADDNSCMTIQAPAKVNLVLRILGKRADGFHDIETLMAPVTLADEIDIEVSEGSGIALDCSDPSVPTDASNLVWRAAEAFATRTGLTFHTSINLRKNIPSGAGLGGGSSDAAAVLVAINRLLDARLADVELEAIAATLGSDIPFFIRNRPAICRGRGETMELAGSVPDANLLLVKPPFPVSTAWAYKAWAADGKPDSTAPTQFLGDIELTNDLEAPVFNKFLLLPAIKSWLIAQPEVSAAMMSGSGSTVFAVLNRTASNLFERIRARFGEHMWTCACRIKAPGGSVAVPSHFSPMNTNQR